MNKRYHGFSKTSLGQQIIDVINHKDRLIELQAFSREGFCAVTALVSQLSPILLSLKETDPKAFNFAKQFVGDYVGNMMRNANYKIIQEQKSVPGKLFTVAAVWAPI